MKTFLCTLFVFFAILSTDPTWAGTATLFWNASPEGDLGGYRIYHGASSGSYTAVFDVGNVTQYTINNLTDGETYYFAVTAYDTSGNESGFSNVVSKIIGTTTSSNTSSSASGGGCGRIEDISGGSGPTAGQLMLNLAMLALILTLPRRMWQWVKAGKESIMKFSYETAFSRTSLTMNSIFIFLLFLIALIMTPGPSLAANYYIAMNGNDSNPGTEASPWRNPWLIANKTLSPGDTVYIKAGAYSIISQSWTNYNCPTIHPRQSGTSANRITIRNYPGDSVTLSTTSGVGSNVIGICEDNPVDYITIDGFEVTGAAVMAFSSGSKLDGTTIQNMVIHDINNTACDNTSGIRLENVGPGSLIKNNKIYNVNNSCGDANATGMTIYFSSGVTIENNEVYNTRSGIHPKGYNDNITIRYNYLHDINIYAFGMSFAGGDVLDNIDIYNNVVALTSGSGFKMDSGGDAGPNNNFDFYNNTIYNYSSICLQGPEYQGSRNFKAYNNICVRTGSATNDVQTFDSANCSGPSAVISVMNYNLYYRTTGLSFRYGLGGCNQTYTSLSSWQSSGHGLDQNSISSDPLFVGPLTSAAGFKLQALSPVRNSGRVGGVSGGTAVNIGAYATGTEIIGLINQPIPPDTTPPTSPTGLTVN